MESPIDKILSRLNRVRETGQDKWIASCPGHEDKHASLSIKRTDDDKVLLHCFAGCSISDVLASIGAEIEDLFPSGVKGNNKRIRNFPSARELLNLLLCDIAAIYIVANNIRNKNETPEDDWKRFDKSINNVYTAIAAIKRL